jgi:hypothetical protein
MRPRIDVIYRVPPDLIFTRPEKPDPNWGYTVVTWRAELVGYLYSSECVSSPGGHRRIGWGFKVSSYDSEPWYDTRDEATIHLWNYVISAPTRWGVDMRRMLAGIAVQEAP